MMRVSHEPKRDLAMTGSRGNASQFGAALLESRWPRAGLGTHDVVPRGCIGRFAALENAWVFEDGSMGRRHYGDGEPLDHLARIFREMSRTHPDAGMIGYVAYEFGYHWLQLSAPTTSATGLPVPLVQFLFFDDVKFRKPGPIRPASHPIGNLQRTVNRPHVRAWVDRAAYFRAVKRIKEHIEAGDIYQANFTQAFDIETDRSGVEIYRLLAARNPAPFSAYLRFAPVRITGPDQRTIDFPEMEIICNSPERFWRQKGRRVETRPIKGTIGRAGSPDADRAALRALLISAKDRAELLMITDLERNDLGRCAQIGSVRTGALRRARAYASVWHLESTVTAEVPEDIGWLEIMRCLFPGGSITGAPKRRAVEILRALEAVPRGVYCGAIGWVGAHGDADFAIAIRTAVKVGRTVRVFGGGGIVADSDPASEYEESLLKIAPIVECLCESDRSDRSDRSDPTEQSTNNVNSPPVAI